AAGAVRGVARLAGRTRAVAQLAYVDWTAGVPGCGGAVAGTDGARRHPASGSGLPRVHGRHPVPADREALRAILGPSAAALVPPGGDAEHVAAGDARAAVGDSGLVAAAAPARPALPAAAGVVGAGGAVLLDPQRQARRLHSAGAADGLPRARPAAAGHRPPGGRAAARTRLHP